ncbi:hypothetical protein [Cellulomonas sp. RIT-PI-Y]|uniref:hypothetical protein n=1 Tax=Cellulomonas sp. RIT-PI-Y TaxID=3035297 RepID=UPI0021D9F7BA|nr:hypothetical protein [Cellulomonas sp. RIT-PI-Y]
MGLTVEVLPDEGAPQVGVTVDGLPAGVPSTVTVERSTDGRTWQPVRGALEDSVTGGGFWRDHVAPLNIETTYRVSGPTLGGQADTTANIYVPSDRAWLQDPLDPRAAVPITWLHGHDDAILILADTAASIARQQVADVVLPQGSRLPVASLGARRAPEGVLLHLRAMAAAQGELVRQLRALFDQAGVLVLRGMPIELDLDPVTHLISPAVQDSPVVGGVLGLREWQFESTQVRAPSPRIAVPWWTYDQVRELWAGLTYDAVSAARPGATYLDWLRDPSPAASGATARSADVS